MHYIEIKGEFSINNLPSTSVFANCTIGVNLVPYMLMGGVFNADNKSDGQGFPPTM